MAPSLLSTTSLLALVLALQARAQDLQINTPLGTYQCQAAQYAFSCPKTPCSVVARPSDDPTSSLKDFGSQDSTSGAVSWTPVDQAEGTQFTMWITDSQGNTISSSPVTVASGSDDCLNGSSGSSGSSGSASASGSSTAASDKDASSTTSGAKATASDKASSAMSGASSAASSAASKASSAASGASSAASSASESADAAAASASGEAGDDNAAGSLAIKGSLIGAALLAASAALF
ncbi:hypothetical protein JCM6882_009680 [Rhodosporidiobolus microsporus]